MYYKFIIVEQFESEDYFDTDPYGYYIELDGKRIANFGDDYHDKGRDKALGFIDGWSEAMKYSQGTGSSECICEYEFEARADWED